MFKPYYNRIEVKPYSKESNFVNDDKSLITAGEVIAVGRDVTFVTVGDKIHFDSWGCVPTTDEVDGIEHYTIEESSKLIKGMDDGR